MRIAYLNPVGHVGGAERVLLSVMAAAVKTDPTVETYLIVSTDGPLLGLAKEFGVRTMLLPQPDGLAKLGDFRYRDSGRCERLRSLLQQVRITPDVWRYSCRLRAILRNIRADLVHSNGIKSHLMARFAGTKPVVWHVHDFYSDRPLVRRMLRWAQRGVVGAITISQAVDRDMQTLLPKLPTHVVLNAIDVDKFAPGPAEPTLLDRLAGLPTAPAGSVRVGLVATYARWKGQDVFLHAVSHYLRQTSGPSVRFYVIGGPIYHTQGSQFSADELRTLAHNLGLQSHLGFIDFQEDLTSIYRGLDIVVHASTRPEPFGLTIVEAMACGRAVIVARAGGASELFTHEQDAIGVTPGDVPGLTLAMRTLVEDAPFRRRLAENARVTAVRRFNQSRLGPQILEAYRTFLGGRKKVTFGPSESGENKGNDCLEIGHLRGKNG